MIGPAGLLLVTFVVPQQKEAEAGTALRAQAAEEQAVPTRTEIESAIDRGLDFLLQDQNPDGSWGGPRDKTFTDLFANAATHDAWTVGTTGLVCSALLELGQGDKAVDALERGLDFLYENRDVKRPAEWDIDNNWGNIYGLKAVSEALLSGRWTDKPREVRLAEAAQGFIKGLANYQSPNGGWAYYANPGAAWRPEWATSFTTAAAVDALIDAEAAGVAVEAKRQAAAVLAIRRSRLPTGAYTYSVEAVPSPGNLVGINQVKGSLGRIQVCNLALLRAGEDVGEGERLRGLELFFEHHKFLDVALRKPIPHEAYYANAAYFYLFGHYYAARLIATLPAERQSAFWPRLQREILKTQESDGGMWDFWISSHTKPYGTAFGILALGLSIEPEG